jgi:hypothetical protein
MKSNIKSFLLIFFLGAFFCILGGYVLFGNHIFEIGSPLFQFVSFGIIGSLAFYLFYTRKFYIAGAALFALFVGLYYMNGQQHLISHSFYFITFIISVFIYTVVIFDHLKLAWYIRPIILSAMISLFFVSNTFLLFVIYQIKVNSSAVFKNMWMGSLVGLGLGIGLEVANRIIERK